MRVWKALVMFGVVFVSLALGGQAFAINGLAKGDTPKYGADFSHFDYVNANAPKQGKLTLSAFGTFEHLNPFLLKGISAAGLGDLVFESLLEKSLDEPFTSYALLADRFSLADDKLSVTFHLDSRAHFSNGDPVTAEDVKFSIDTLLSEQAHPQFRFYYSDIDRVEVIDAETVKVHFKQVNPELHLIVGDIPIFSKEWLQGQAFDKTTKIKPIASGPYKVSSFSVGKNIDYVRDENYWAKDLPVRKGMYNFSEIQFKYYKDQTIALEAFKAGEFDFFAENHSKRWARDHTGKKYDSGEIVKETLAHSNGTGIQGFIMNTRRALFSDRRVRQAMTLAFDFEWSNNKLFYGQYVRNESYFSNSDLASSGLPSEAELELLTPYKEVLPETVFNQEWMSPSTKKPNSIRKNLRLAKQLLTQAGWKIKDGVLKNDKGDVFEFEIILVSKSFERIMAPYVGHLKRLGVQVSYRTIDPALFEKRVQSFDFDMIVASYPESQSPGNELINMFSSESANSEGSRNFAGINSPVVDDLVSRIILAKNRDALKVATHALDRVLLNEYYLVPNWYINVHRVSYYKQLEHSDVLPLYYSVTAWMLKTWWMKP